MHHDQESQPTGQSRGEGMNPLTKKLVLAFVVFDFFLISGFLLYFFGFNFKNFQFESPKTNQFSVTSTSTVEVQELMVRTASELKTYIVNNQKVFVNWNQGAIPVPREEANQLLTQVNPSYRDQLPYGGAGEADNEQEQACDRCEIFVFEAGEISTPSSLAGTKLYYLFLPDLGMGVHYQEALVVYFSDEQTFLHLKEIPDPAISFRYDFDRWELFSETIEYELPQLSEVPETLSITNRNVFLRIDGSYFPKEVDRSIDSLISNVSGNVGGIYHVSEQKVVTQSDLGRVVANHDQYGPVYFDGHRYAIRRAYGSTFLYRV